MRSRHGRKLLFAFAVLIGLPPSLSHAAEFHSCAEVRDYLNASGAAADSLYARTVDLQRAVQRVKNEESFGAAPCDELIAERAMFEYGIALEKYGASFADRMAQQTWATEAAKAFGDYLSWYLSLSDAKRDRMIRILLRLQGARDEEFKAERAKWVRRRIGSVLNMLGTAYVRAEQHEEMFASYEQHSADTIEIFPSEVARKWYRWLRTKPDYRRQRPDAEIRNLIATDAEARDRWGAFKDFLTSFSRANPSARQEWDGPIRRIGAWLSSGQ